MTSEYSTELSALLTGMQPQASIPTRTINFKRMLRTRWKGMVIVFVVLAVLSAPLAWLSVPIRFTATAEIRCAATRQFILSDTGETSGNYGLFLQTQRTIIQSASIMERVAEDPRVRDLPWLANQTDKVFYLQANVNVTNPRSTEILSVQFSAPNPQDAKLVVATIVDKYLGYARMAEDQQSSGRLQRLKELQSQLQSRISITKDTIKAHRDRINSPYAYGPPVSETPEMIALLSLRSKLGDQVVSVEGAIKQRQDLIAKAQELEKQYAASPSTEIQALNVEDLVLQDTRVIGLRQDLSNAETRIAILRDTYQDNQPQLNSAERERNSIKAELDRAVVEARGQALKSIVARATQELEEQQSLLQNLTDQVNVLEQEIEAQRQKDAALNQDLGDVQTYVNEVEQLQRTLERVETKIDQIEFEQNAPGRVSQQGTATVPTTPDRRKQMQMVLLAVLASGGMGALWGLYREFTDQDVRSSQDLGYITKLPVLAAIPHASVDRVPKDARVAMVTASHPDSTTADEYRRILTRIVYPPEGAAEINTCLIASPSRGDGKTSLACNLAIALAQANRRVLLVDISSRHPSIEKCFDLAPEVGLSEVLVENLDPAAVYRETGFPNLYVLGPGFRGRELVGKLASREIGEFFESAEAQFEHVVIDTPPSLFMSDAKLLAPIVDGVIVVIGAGITKIGMIRRCLQDMQTIGANVIGIVINGVRPYRGGYISRNLSDYYSYSEGRHDHKPRRGGSAASHEYGADDDDAPAVILLPDDPGSAASPDEADEDKRDVPGTGTRA